MKDDNEDMGYQIAGGIAGLIALGLFIWFCVWACNGALSWWRDITYESPQDVAERQERYARLEEEWAKDPTNPAVIAQKCIDQGGTPIISVWFGNVKECKGAGGDKNVHVEVNQ